MDASPKYENDKDVGVCWWVERCSVGATCVRDKVSWYWWCCTMVVIVTVVDATPAAAVTTQQFNIVRVVARW